MNTEFIEKFNMISPGDRVLCAVSGGADSMCLLHFLHENREKMGADVAAAHFDHGLRGEESERDRQFVEAWCKSREIACIWEKGEVLAFGKSRGMGTEEAARALRYDFLHRAARTLGCNKIATAHNADDNAETVIFNLARGAGPAGLSGIPPVRGEIIRPLLGTSRQEILAYLNENSVPHVEDSTNAGDDYSRNIIRHRVIPVLKDINPGFLENVKKTTLLLRRDEEYLNGLARDFIRRELRDGALETAGLLALPRPVAARVIRALCPENLSKDHVDRVFDLLPGGELKKIHLPGITLTKDQGRLFFGGGQGDLFPDTRLNIPGITGIPGTNFQIRSEIIENQGEINSSLRTFYFNCDNICGNIFCTRRREGDKVRLLGRGCTKSLKNLFGEAKMTQAERNRTLVLRDQAGIAAVLGFGVAERCASCGAGKKLRITIENTGETNNVG